FGAAKVDIGDELRSMMLDGAGETGAGSNAEDIIAQFEALAEGLEHDPFLIEAQLSEMLSGFPEEHQTALVALLISSEVPAMRDASLGWLLHPKPAVSVLIFAES
ncbi:MAG: hypothetical protein M3O32_20930, partial [Actinomycetota bacterium]|nr:hypothetical protein [Actinomycetota bacterium]